MVRAFWLLIAAGIIVGLTISSRFVSMAQIPVRSEQADSNSLHAGRQSEKPRDGEQLAPGGERRAAQAESRGGSGAATLQDALLRPFDFPFAHPTPLAQVCIHLKQTLKAPVVMDLAALDRQNVEPEAPVQLELEGVRLKTGLKLLLDQVGLTYRIEAEDNLMVITDHEGSQDPGERIWAEIRALHRDLHDVQDSLDELREFFGDDRQSGPRVRKPTIIEEMPEGAFERREESPAKPGNAGEKPAGKAAEKPKGLGTPPGSREPPQRIPLSFRRRDR
jgi:hypothetical protein